MCSDIDVSVLIALVEERPELWDRSLAVYKNRSRARESWRSICCALNPRFEELKESDRHNYGQLVLKKWNNIRDQYMKSKNKEEKASKSGAGGRRSRKYIYHESLQFLEKIRIPSEPIGAEEEPQEHVAEEGLLREPHLSPPRPITREPTKRHPRKRRKVLVPGFEPETVQEPETREPDPERHILFFKGILPSIAQFDDAQTIDFQMGVLQLIKNIRQGHSSTSAQPFHNPLGSIYGNFGPPYQPSPPYTPVPPTSRFNSVQQSQMYEAFRAQRFVRVKTESPGSDRSSTSSLQDRSPNELVSSQFSDSS